MGWIKKKKRERNGREIKSDRVLCSIVKSTCSEFGG